MAVDRLARTVDRLWRQEDANPRLTQEVGEGEREGDGEVEDSWKKGVLLGIFHEYQFRAFLYFMRNFPEVYKAKSNNFYKVP